MAKTKGKGICPICGMKNCTCDHTTKAVPALMGDPRPRRSPQSVFKDAVGNRDGSSIAAEGMSAANYSMHKRGAKMKMRKSGGGGDYVPDKTPTPTPKSAGKYKIGNAPAKNVLRGNQPPAKRGGGIAYKMDKAMPMPMSTPAMSSMAPRPMPPKMPPTAPSMMRPNPATPMRPAMSGTGMSSMYKGKKMAKKDGLDEVIPQVRRQMSEAEHMDWALAQPQMQASSGRGAVWTQKPGYARVTMTADTNGKKEIKDFDIIKPRIDVHMVKPPKPGSTSGGRGAGTRKMAKSDSNGQGAYINGRPAQINKRSK